MSKYTTRRGTILAKSGGFCWYCGISITLEEMHIEHVIPKCHGGGNGVNNLVPACQPCNNRKNRHQLEAFRPRHFCYQQGIQPFTDDQLQWLADIGFPQVRELTTTHTFWFENRGEA